MKPEVPDKGKAACVTSHYRKLSFNNLVDLVGRRSSKNVTMVLLEDVHLYYVVRKTKK
jgi:hypothetical protein